MPARKVRSAAADWRSIAAISAFRPLAAEAPGGVPPGRCTSGKRGPSMIGLSVT